MESPILLFRSDILRLQMRQISLLLAYGMVTWHRPSDKLSRHCQRVLQYLCPTSSAVNWVESLGMRAKSTRIASDWKRCVTHRQHTEWNLQLASADDGRNTLKGFVCQMLDWLAQEQHTVACYLWNSASSSLQFVTIHMKIMQTTGGVYII